MDRREAIPLSGTTYYMQRGMSGSGSMHNPNMSFQPNIGVSSGSIGAALPMDPSPPAISPHGVNVGAPSAVPPSETVRRKRGRPRKYGPDGTVSLGLSPTSSSSPLSGSPSQKRGRGRPPGTGRNQQIASLGGWLSGSAGMGFTPHVITIAVGEDITAKIMSFSQQGPRAICILSANGCVSNVTLRQPSSGGNITYEGRFEILCLSGSFLLSDSGGPRARSGGLSVSLANPDGRVIGGGVGGVLIAASPVQVIVGSFTWGNVKSKNKSGRGGETSGDIDRRPAESPVVPATSAPPSQSLTSPTSSLGGWPVSRSMDMQNTHVDIDLMRG
ncbi:hypothetical protein NMG60_11022887 [Bertholletia excelsa]